MQVLEETGCDVSKLLKMDDHIEVSIGQQRVRLYIITGVKEDTVFAPQTKKEISVCKFSNLSSSFYSVKQFFRTYQHHVMKIWHGIGMHVMVP